MPAAVLFDLYDTIVRANWARWRREAAALVGVDESVLDRAFHDTRGPRNTGAFPDVEGECRAIIEATGIEDPPADLVRSFASAEFAFQRDHITLEPDAEPVARELRARGVQTAVVSNCSHNTEALVDRLGLQGLYDAVVMSFRVGARKPDRRIYETTLRGLGGINPADALFVDDQVAFCDGARALGMDTRLIIRPHAMPPEGISWDTNGHTVIEELAPIVEA
jgi:putative hydrolase of the HAD superfamily